jgi:hypothetical protein
MRVAGRTGACLPLLLLLTGAAAARETATSDTRAHSVPAKRGGARRGHSRPPLRNPALASAGSPIQPHDAARLDRRGWLRGPRGRAAVVSWDGRAPRGAGGVGRGLGWVSEGDGARLGACWAQSGSWSADWMEGIGSGGVRCLRLPAGALGLPVGVYFTWTAPRGGGAGSRMSCLVIPYIDAFDPGKSNRRAHRIHPHWYKHTQPMLRLLASGRAAARQGALTPLQGGGGLLRSVIRLHGCMLSSIKRSIDRFMMV